MSETGLKAFDSTLHLTHVWLNEIMRSMGWEDRRQAYHALRAVLHALRDQLTVDETAALGAQLPMLVRGFYYEGWHPARVPMKERKKSTFLMHVGASYQNEPNADLEGITRAVFSVLAKHVTTGEISDVQHLLSEEVRALWPTS